MKQIQFIRRLREKSSLFSKSLFYFTFALIVDIKPKVTTISQIYMRSE
jgi:hypothetical protein